MVFDLSSIQRSTQLPPRLCLYGVAGIGKTTFAASTPNPIYLPVEDGLGQLDVAAFPRPQNFDQVIEAVTSLIQGDHDYKTLVIDSLSRLESLVWDHVCANIPNEKGGAVSAIENYGYGKGFTHALGEWRRLLRGLDILREKRGMAIVLIAHSQVVKFEAPDAEPYDRYQLRVHKLAEAAIVEWSDAVLFANYEVVVVDSGSSSNKKRGVGKGKRLLHTNERPAFKAKNRYSMPDTLTLDWSDVAPHCGVKKTETKPKPKPKTPAKSATAAASK